MHFNVAMIIRQGKVKTICSDTNTCHKLFPWFIWQQKQKPTQLANHQLGWAETKLLQKNEINNTWRSCIQLCTMMADAVVAKCRAECLVLLLIVHEPPTLFTTGCPLAGVLPFFFSLSHFHVCWIFFSSFSLHIAFFLEADCCFQRAAATCERKSFEHGQKFPIVKVRLLTWTWKRAYQKDESSRQ